MTKLGPAQRKVLFLIKDQGLSQKHISERLKISQPRVSKIVKQLINKKVLGDYKKGGLSKGGVVGKKPKKSYWRLHGLQIEIKPYYFTEKYHRIRKDIGNMSIPYGNWKVSLYSNKIMMWLNANFDFRSQDDADCVMQMNIDFDRTLSHISNRYGFKYEKDKKVSIRILKQHLALTNSDLSKSIEKDQIQIKWVDGRVYFIIDKSKGLREHEYVHKDLLFTHKDRIEKQINDWAKYDPLTNSQLTSRLVDLLSAVEKQVEINERIAESLSNIKEKIRELEVR